MPLAATAAPAGISCLQKEVAGNLGSSPLASLGWITLTQDLSYALRLPSRLFLWHKAVLRVVTTLEGFLKPL